MTAPRSVKVGAVELRCENHDEVIATEGNAYPDKPHGPYVSRGGMIRVYALAYGKWHAECAGEVPCSVVAFTPESAADALTAKLKQLRAALADVLGDEEGS